MYYEIASLEKNANHTKCKSKYSTMCKLSSRGFLKKVYFRLLLCPAAQNSGKDVIISIKGLVQVPSEFFSIHSMYSVLTEAWVRIRSKRLWRTKFPLKIQVFLLIYICWWVTLTKNNLINRKRQRETPCNFIINDGRLDFFN